MDLGSWADWAAAATSAIAGVAAVASVTRAKSAAEESRRTTGLVASVELARRHDELAPPAAVDLGEWTIKGPVDRMVSAFTVTNTTVHDYLISWQYIDEFSTYALRESRKEPEPIRPGECLEIEAWPIARLPTNKMAALVLDFELVDNSCQCGNLLAHRWRVFSPVPTERLNIAFDSWCAKHGVVPKHVLVELLRDRGNYNTPLDLAVDLCDRWELSGASSIPNTENLTVDVRLTLNEMVDSGLVVKVEMPHPHGLLYRLVKSAPRSR